MKLAPHERASWGRTFRRARRAGAGVVEALERADAEVLCDRGRARDVAGELRQLELVRGATLGRRRRGPRRASSAELDVDQVEQLELALDVDQAEQQLELALDGAR